MTAVDGLQVHEGVEVVVHQDHRLRRRQRVPVRRDARGRQQQRHGLVLLEGPHHRHALLARHRALQLRVAQALVSRQHLPRHQLQHLRLLREHHLLRAPSRHVVREVADAQRLLQQQLQHRQLPGAGEGVELRPRRQRQATCDWNARRARQLVDGRAEQRVRVDGEDLLQALLKSYLGE